jgi:excinuclease ABC subunit A
MMLGYPAIAPMNTPSDSKYLAQVLGAQRISVRGARTHNLKNVDLDIPRNQLVVICTPRDSVAMWRACQPMRASFCS